MDLLTSRKLFLEKKIFNSLSRYIQMSLDIVKN